MTSKQKIARLAFWSIVVALVVLVLMGLAWLMTGSVALYSDALSDAGGPAPTYIDMMRHNIGTIAGAIRGS